VGKFAAFIGRPKTSVSAPWLPD